MRRRWKVLIGLGTVLAALLVLNAAVIGGQTKRAELTAPGGQILELSSAQLQVVDQPATEPGPAGEGAPILLLHCHACSLQWWDALVPLINRRHRVIRVDLIGHGGSQKPRSGYGIEQQEAAVAEALNRLGVEGAVAVGHSMGGTVAVALAEQASQLVDRVAVLGTAPDEETASLPFVARLTYAPLIGEALWRTRLDGLIRSGYESAFAPGFDFEAAFGDPDQVVEDNRRMTYTSYEAAGSAGDEFLDTGDLPTRLAATGVPFLAILGAEDQIVDTEAAAAAYEAVPGAEVRVLDGVGHSPNLEAPERTAELLLAFAGEAVSAAAGRRPLSGR